MRIASLFSGIGGFELGLGRDHELTLVNDIDPEARAVLSVRFPETTLVDDVALVKSEHLADAELLMAGFPCQDVSIVGGQRGLNGKKTSLVRHVFRLAEEARPHRILLENVQSIRFVHGGRVLAYLMDEAERLKYAWAYRTLDSHGFGLPQRRRRFYFLASRVDDPGCALFGDPGEPLPKERIDLDRPVGFYWTEGRAGHGMTCDALPPMKSGSAIGIASPPAVLLPAGQVVRPTIETAERIQGFPPGWSAAASTRSRWRLIGNAVSPPVLSWIAGQLGNTSPWSDDLRNAMPTQPVWPLAAWGNGRGRRFSVEVAEAPSALDVGHISDSVYEWCPLSHRALSGFISRARSSRLRYPAGFLEKLEVALTAAT